MFCLVWFGFIEGKSLDHILPLVYRILYIYVKAPAGRVFK